MLGGTTTYLIIGAHFGRQSSGLLEMVFVGAVNGGVVAVFAFAGSVAGGHLPDLVRRPVHATNVPSGATETSAIRMCVCVGVDE